MDFAIGSFADGPSWTRRSLLYDETHVCCFNPAKLDLPAPIDLESYRTAPHALISRRDSLLGYLENSFAAAGVTPNVAVTTTNFFNLLLLAAESPILTTIPARMAARFAGLFPLVVSPLPFAFGNLRAELIWHQRTESDAAYRWLRDAIRSSAALAIPTDTHR